MKEYFFLILRKLLFNQLSTSGDAAIRVMRNSCRASIAEDHGIVTCGEIISAISRACAVASIIPEYPGSQSVE